MAFEPMQEVTRNPCYVELLTAEQFIEMYRHDRDNIEWARPVPAPLGSRALGHILGGYSITKRTTSSRARLSRK